MGGLRGGEGHCGEQMVTGEKCCNELRGFKKRSLCIEMSLGDGESS